MPNYDFICTKCQKRFEIYFSYSEYGKKPVICPHCGSTHTRRRMTRVRVIKSEETRLEALESEITHLEGLEDDPRALGRMMRRLGKEIGEELPPEFDEVVDRLEAGQSPEEIENALPDLAEGEGAASEE